MIDKDIVINMEGICKTFPGVRALENVDFRLKKGTVHILLGENGAGKSTLVKILSGAHSMTAGQIFLNGKQVVIRNPRHARELGIGIIYQELNLIKNLSVAENIYLGREPVKKRIKINDSLMKSLSKKVLAELGVRIDPNCPIKKLGIAQGAPILETIELMPETAATQATTLLHQLEMELAQF